MKAEEQVLLGEYFVLTSGYSATGGLVNENEKAILFILEGNNLYRRATAEEVMIRAKWHPILSAIK